MSERPTPETDAEVGYFDLETAVNADFARRLERERDEAREEISSIRNALSHNGQAVGNGDHDYSIIEIIENLIKSRYYFVRKSDSLEQERDEAKEERDRFRSLNESYAACWDEIRAALGQGDQTCDLDRVLKAIRERDEAREEANKLSGAYEDATNYYARMIELKDELDKLNTQLKQNTK